MAFSAAVKLMEGVIEMSGRRYANNLISQCMFYVSDMLLSFETVCLNATGVKNPGQVLHFLTPVKIIGWVGKMTLSVFCARPRTQRLM